MVSWYFIERACFSLISAFTVPRLISGARAELHGRGG